jgi:branched-chain amino acid transport system substrate-binding protein
MKTVFISDDGVKDQTFIKVAGSYAEGVYASGPRDTTKNPLAVAAIAEHRKTYGSEPGAFYLNAYAAIQAVLNAISKAKSTEYSAVAKALRTYQTDTPLGKIKFNKEGDAIGAGFSIYQVSKGVYVELK